MSWELILRHCNGIEASNEATRVQLELTAAQVAALKALAKAGCAKETAEQSLPSHCQAIVDSECGLRSEDARIDQATMSAPKKWVCKGCRVICTNGVTPDSML